MKKTAFLISFCLVLIISINAQIKHKRMMDDHSINFYDVCKEAEKYFKSYDKNKKGSGWKSYQRWKYANEYKYYPSGNRINTDPFFAENTYETFLKNNPAIPTKTSFPNGWNELGPLTIDSITNQYSVGLGRVVALHVDPSNTNKMYIGSRSGGFWKTIDGGTTWQGGSTDFLIASGVNTIDASPTNSDSILINIRNADNGYSHGIYRSVDGGNSWALSNFSPANVGYGGLGDNFKIYKIAYHPLVPDLILIGTSEGLYRSDDNLQTWTNLLNNPGDITDIAFHPTNPDIIYLYDNYYWGSNLNVVLRSIDMGLSFSSSDTLLGNNDLRGYLSVSNDCPSCLYFGSTNGIWRSTDEGINFTFLNNPPQSCLGFAVNDTDTSKMIYGYVDIEASLDGGQTFNQITWWSLGDPNHGTGSYYDKLHNSGHYVHADLHPAKCINGIFYIGTDGYFCKSSNNGSTWEILSNGTGIRENYKLGVSQSNHFRSISGSQDNGTSIKHKDNWIEFYGADGMEGIIHTLNDNWMIGSVQYGGRIRTKDGGQTNDGASPSDQSGDGNAAWEAPLAYDPNNHMKIVHFSDSIFVSEDFGTTWNYKGKPSSFSANINQAAIAENNSDIIVISNYDNIDKSIDGGATFSSINNNLPSKTIQDIAFDPNDDDVIIVTYASYHNNNSKVYMTNNGGTSWTNITYNLGDMPIHSVVIDHTSASNIYLGAEIGVYTKPINSSNWTLYNDSLPNTTIEELEIVYGSNTIKVATWGRGLWEYTLVGRNDYPSILKTDITDLPTDFNPKESIDQYVSCIISYDNTITNAYVKWSENNPTFGNSINMTNTQDSTWVSQTPIPNFPSGTKMYFKVYAVGNNNDTSETYKFMYTVKPFDYCTSSGSITYQGNVTNVDFNTLNNSTGKTQPYTDYTSTDSTTVIINNSYDLSVNLNTDNGNYTYYAKAWIDWNMDTDFEDVNESYELGYATNTSNGPTNLSPLSITIPSNASLGKTRMRVACKYNSYPSECDNNIDGEVEDYSIIVEGSQGLVNNPIAESVIKAYPNPINDKVTLDLLKIMKNVKIEVYDIRGKIILSSLKKNSQYVELDFSDQASGIYYLHVQFEKKVEIIKVVKD